MSACATSSPHMPPSAIYAIRTGAGRKVNERHVWVQVGSPGALAQIHRVALEIGERAVVERALMRRAQHDARRQPGLERLLPARRAQAPAVARAKAGEAAIRHRRREVVAARFGE